MANYNKIKTVVPSWSRLVVAVGRNRKVEEWEVHHRGRREDQEAEKRSSKEIRWRGRARERDSSSLPSLSMVRWNAQGPIKVRGRIARVGLGCLRVVSRYSGGVPYHHYGLARIGNSEVFFVSFSLLFFCFVIIIKYSRAQEGNQSSYPPSSSLSVALELNGYSWVTEFLVFLSVLAFFSNNPPKLSLDGNSSPNGLGHSLMLGVNSSLCVIRVGFQLYGQLKKSPHDVTGVLGSSAVLTVSQTTRLGKGGSVMTRDERTS